MRELPTSSLTFDQSFRRTPRHIKEALVNPKIQKLSIIVPCYNEAKTISVILDRIMDLTLTNQIEPEIIVVNDCSTDDSDLMIREWLGENPTAPVRYLCHEKNKGKGAAVQTAIRFATGEYSLIQDADLEYDPTEYNLLLQPILSGHADIVYGSRFMGGNPHRILFFWHTMGNKLLTFFSNIITNMNLTDAHTCYKLIKTTTFQSLPLQEKRFSFDAELNAKLSKIRGLRIYEVGISYYGRTFAEGKKIRLKDAFRTIYALIKYSLLSNPSVQNAN